MSFSSDNNHNQQPLISLDKHYLYIYHLFVSTYYDAK